MNVFQPVTPSTTGVVSLAVYGALVLGLTAVLLFLAGWLGERRRSPEKERAYESGIIPTGPAQVSRPVPFYLVAMFFLVFDVEAAFIFSWAVAYDRLGWVGWLHMTAFIVVLGLGLGYVWLKGGLDWGPHPRSLSPGETGGLRSGGAGSLRSDSPPGGRSQGPGASPSPDSLMKAACASGAKALTPPGSRPRQAGPCLEPCSAPPTRSQGRAP